MAFIGAGQLAMLLFQQRLSESVKPPTEYTNRLRGQEKPFSVLLFIAPDERRNLEIQHGASLLPGEQTTTPVCIMLMLIG